MGAGSRAGRSIEAAAFGELVIVSVPFTASTSFANPAVTIARALSNTFAGIRPADVIPFIAAQMVGAIAALFVCFWLVGEPSRQLEGPRLPAQ